MKASYHNHSYRCHHAVGTEREYVERAIEGGLRIFGFSDHTPYPFPNGYVSHIRMLPGELEGYVDTVLALKKEYAAEIDIRLGLETEYYPAYFENYLRMIEPYPIEYLILGQHYLGNEDGGSWNGHPSDDLTALAAYVDQTIEGIKCGVFSYLAHPDLFNYTGDDKEMYAAEARRLCLAAKEANLPLEINLHGLDTHRHYPNRSFFEIAKEVGNEVILGSDAHAPEEVFPEDVVREAEALVEDIGLTLLPALPAFS